MFVALFTPSTMPGIRRGILKKSSTASFKTTSTTTLADTSTSFKELYLIFKSLIVADLSTKYAQQTFDNFLTECGRYKSSEHTENGLPVTLGWFHDGTRCQIMVGGKSQEHYWAHKKIPREGQRNVRLVHLESAIRHKNGTKRGSVHFSSDTKGLKEAKETKEAGTKRARRDKSSYEDLNLLLAYLGPVYTAPYEAFMDIKSHAIWLLSEIPTKKYVHFGRFDKKAHKGKSLAAVRILQSISQIEDTIQDDCILPTKRVIVGCRKEKAETKGLMMIKAEVHYAKKRIDYGLQSNF